MPPQLPQAIVIETRKKWPIPNDMRLDRPKVALEASRELFKKLHPRAHLRSLTATYNCVGMVIACRRTWVDPECLLRVLRDDGFVQLKNQAEALAGDVVVYRDSENNVSHVGIITTKKLIDPQNPTDFLVVLSKWGADGEYEHDVTDLPFQLGTPTEYWSDRKG